MTPNTKSNKEIVKEIISQVGLDLIQQNSLEWLITQALTLKDQAHKAEVEEAKAHERAFILQELALRDIPSKDGEYPLYTARQISEYLKNEWRVSPTPLPESDKSK